MRHQPNNMWSMNLKKKKEEIPSPALIKKKRKKKELEYKRNLWHETRGGQVKEPVYEMTTTVLILSLKL